MMLAEKGYLEILTESFRRQRLDDTTLKGEYCGNLRGALEIQPYRLSTRKRTLGNCREKIAKEIDKNGAINCKIKLPIAPTDGLKPLKVGKKAEKTYGEKSEKFITSTNEINSSFKDRKSRIDKPECFQENLSSSEEELRDLSSELNKTFHAASRAIPRVIPQENPPESPRRTKNGKPCNTTRQVVELDRSVCRKRCKPTRASFKKKVKFSRPSLNLYKMLATRFSPLKKDFVSYRNFCPIEKI